jgi:hypothetical protein
VHSRPAPFRVLVSFVLALVVTKLGLPAVVQANPVLGFLETWPGVSLGGWDGGGVQPGANPGTGGVDGASDGFLTIARSTLSQLGAKSNATPYTGNWWAANATQVRFFLNDINTNEPLEIHFSIGNGGNFWQYNTGFLPPENGWAEFSVDLRDSANFTRTISFDELGFAGALQAVDRVLIRHDNEPYVQSPDLMQGDFGLDNFLITNPLIGVPPSSAVAGRPVALAPPFPNPSRGPVAFQLESFDAEPVRVLIVDARGRIVRRAEMPGAPGPRMWIWDGLDDVGRRVSAGAYRVRALGRGGGTSQPLIRVN